MSGRKKEESKVSELSKRYRVDYVQSAGMNTAIAGKVEAAMNDGDENGWRLINVTQHAGIVLLYWDTRPATFTPIGPGMVELDDPFNDLLLDAEDKSD